VEHELIKCNFRTDKKQLNRSCKKQAFCGCRSCGLDFCKDHINKGKHNCDFKFAERLNSLLDDLGNDEIKTPIAKVQLENCDREDNISVSDTEIDLALEEVENSHGKVERKKFIPREPPSPVSSTHSRPRPSKLDAVVKNMIKTEKKPIERQQVILESKPNGVTQSVKHGLIPESKIIGISEIRDEIKEQFLERQFLEFTVNSHGLLTRTVNFEFVDYKIESTDKRFVTASGSPLNFPYIVTLEVQITTSVNSFNSTFRLPYKTEILHVNYELLVQLCSPGNLDLLNDYKVAAGKMAFSFKNLVSLNVDRYAPEILVNTQYLALMKFASLHGMVDRRDFPLPQANPFAHMGTESLRLKTLSAIYLASSLLYASSVSLVGATLSASQSGLAWGLSKLGDAIPLPTQKMLLPASEVLSNASVSQSKVDVKKLSLDSGSFLTNGLKKIFRPSTSQLIYLSNTGLKEPIIQKLEKKNLSVCTKVSKCVTRVLHQPSVSLKMSPILALSILGGFTLGVIGLRYALGRISRPLRILYSIAQTSSNTSKSTIDVASFLTDSVAKGSALLPLITRRLSPILIKECFQKSSCPFIDTWLAI